MTYQGSKERIAEELAEILSRHRSVNQIYWEPFVGSASVFCRMPGPKLGTDIMASLIYLWNELIDDTFSEPGYITKEQYDEAMKSEEHSSLRAYIGFFWSFSCLFDKGYSPETYRRGKSFYKMMERAKMLSKQPHTMLRSASYNEVELPSPALIYCDPPYIGTLRYRGTPEFDHEKFYSWCERKKAEGHTVFISEYEMPYPFYQIHEFPFSTNMATLHREKQKPERLFTL